MANQVIAPNVLEEQNQRRLPLGGARRLAVVAVLAAVLVAAAVWSQPVLAAMQLSFFNIVANPTGVVLEWGTSAEVNLAGFDILCKQASEPDSAYHPIGFMPAKGGPTTPAQYTFPVTSGLIPGVPYCFQLREVTTDGSIGEAPALCGYGPNVTPTPSLGVIPTFFITQTAVIGVIPTDAAGNPIRIPPLPGAVPVAVPTDAFGNPVVTPVAPAAIPTDAFGNPIPAAVATDAFGNPMPAAVATDAFGNPVPAAVATDAFGNPVPAAVATDAFGNPVPVAVPTDAFGSPLPTPQPPTPTINPFAPPTPIVVTPQAAAPVDSALAAAAPAESAFAAAAPVDPALAAAAPDPALMPAAALAPAAQYVVVTATPTQAPVALGVVLTPLPTTTPAPPGLQLVNGAEPTTQNLMVMFLCLTFTGASAIGVLGLISGIMFMRGRSTQQTSIERYTTPRRR